MILSSSIEYLSARMYNSSIIAGESKDSDWKKEVDDPKLLLKFWRTISLLYNSIYWMAWPNLLVMSQIVSSSCLRIVYKELIFLFFHIEQRYYDTNATHSSLNEFLSYARAYGTRLTRALENWPRTLYTTDGHCRHLVSSPEYNGTCDRKG